MIHIAKEGKKLEEEIEKSCSEQNIFTLRIRDINPMLLKKGAKVPKNKFDYLLYHKLHLFPMELKSTKGKSISFDEKIIKAYQIKSLENAAKFPGVIPGFLFNFREPDNRAFFVHINDFITYKNIAENELEHTYRSKVNKSSIPIGICEEVGIEIHNVQKKVKYRYYINKLLDELIGEYTSGK